MHILYLVGRELGYTRNDVLLRAFRRLGTVHVIGETSAGSLSLRIGRVLVRALPHLLTQQYDLIFVGFYGHLLMLPIGLFARSPILFDAFVSTYDTLCFDRALFAPHSVVGRLTFWLDQTSCRLADTVLLDTHAHADYFVRTFALSPDKVRFLPVGCNEDIFFPRPHVKRDNTTRILYYSTYLPLHGVETVIRAAALLRSERRLHFRLIGTGPEYVRVRQLANALGLQNITFVPFVPLQDLAIEIANADICLGGHFGSSKKAARVIAGKTFQCIAMGKPTVVGDNAANRELLQHGHDAWFCQMNDHKALAEAILHLITNPDLCLHLGNNARQTFLERASVQTLSNQLEKIVKSLIG
jgi:glycosyltransferase involved in cell wall biosynthesis